jgi:hypothetical protein
MERTEVKCQNLMKKQGMQGENDRYFSSVAAVTLTKYVSYSRSFMLIRIAQCSSTAVRCTLWSVLVPESLWCFGPPMPKSRSVQT